MGEWRTMKRWLLKKRFSLITTLLCLGSMLIIVLWFKHKDNCMGPHITAPQSRSAPKTFNHCKGCNCMGPHIPAPQKKSAAKTFNQCKGCKVAMEEILQNYSQNWQKQEDNYQKFRAELRDKCQGFTEAIITQKNTPVGSKLVYSWHKRTIQVKSELFSTFAKVHPFSDKTWNTCAVIGNGGILSDSGCGEQIDSAQFVIRCNLPPIGNDYEEHVGSKTDLVTANPSILTLKYGSLTERRRAFVERLCPYGNALLLLPTFALDHDTAPCQRAIYTIEEFESPIRPISFNPKYLKNLSNFWRSQGLQSRRMSSGIIMASLALEVCENVHLYGFWPFSSHPFELYDLKHHYYDNRTAVKGVHTMSSEFNFLLKLHSQGVLNLHLQNCHHGET